MRTIAPENIFATAVIQRELDDRARFLAAKLRVTRSKLIGMALSDFVDRLETEGSTRENAARERRR